MNENAYDTIDDEYVPPEALEAGITPEVWLDAQADAENGFRTLDDALLAKIPPEKFSRYKGLLAQRVEIPETPGPLETEETPEYRRELIKFMDDAREYSGGLEAFYGLPENRENALRFGFLKEGVDAEDMAA